MKKGLVLALALLLAALALLSAVAWLRRADLPYNEEGRYFDPADSIVYSDSAVTLLALSTLALAAAALLALWWAVRTWRK
ncbi:MAG TPA: hypothetical protein VN231_08425 [Allosphingosinicella sp.]|nr:hypothetical protein [Allosphingosinicella sp.]